MKRANYTEYPRHSRSITPSDDGNERFEEAMEDLTAIGDAQDEEPMEDDVIDMADEVDYAEAFELDQHPEDDPDDLFASTFGKQVSQEQGLVSNAAEVDISPSRESQSKAVDVLKQPDSYSFLSSEHTASCSGEHLRRGSITPPPFLSFGHNKAALSATGAKPTEPNKTLSKSFQIHKKFHEKVIHLIPRLPNNGLTFEWPERRYWIAVLILDKSLKDATSERHFVWMKGNRFSTMKTVWHRYNETTMTPVKWALLLGQEKVDMADQAQDLDLFNDKLVVLRAVSEYKPASKGKSLIEGLIPEVIELDD